MASIYLSLFLSLSLLCTISQADLINDVCSSSINPPLCNDTLRSDPNYSGSDIRGLSQIIVKKAQEATEATLNVAKTLSTGNMREKAETCVETCGDAMDMLSEGTNLLKAHDRFSISTLQTKGSAALTDVGTCDDEFGEREPAELKQASRKAQDLISVLLAIANRL